MQGTGNDMIAAAADSASSARGPASGPRLVFLYADSRPSTGQANAIKIARRLLAEAGHSTGVLHAPAFGAHGAKGRVLLGMLGRYVGMLARALTYVPRRGVLIVGCGQTRTGLLRDGIPLLLLRWLGRWPVVITLNGNLFPDWAVDGFEARCFRFLARRASAVTVLGDMQRQAMVRLGVAPAKVFILENTSLLAPLDADAVAAKHDLAPGAPLRVLFLSNLVAAKGWREFLAAAALLAADDCGRPVEVTLCGPPFERSVEATEAVKAEIAERLEQINAAGDGRLTARWVPGAYGDDKQQLFAQAHVFVLPTRYSVEAQPLVLIEAMSQGCAVISTEAGEIPSTVGAAGLLLSPANPEAIRNALVTLAGDPAERLRRAQLGLERARGPLSPASHAAKWQALIDRARGADRDNR